MTDEKPPCAQCLRCASLGEIYVKETDSWEPCPECDRVDPTMVPVTLKRSPLPK